MNTTSSNYDNVKDCLGCEVKAIKQEIGQPVKDYSHLEFLATRLSRACDEEDSEDINYYLSQITEGEW